MEIFTAIVLAIVAESVWETLKMTWQSGKISLDRIGALIVSQFIAIGCGFDIMDCFDIPMSIPWVGIILTGVLISRGSNFIHDLLDKATSYKTK